MKTIYLVIEKKLKDDFVYNICCYFRRFNIKILNFKMLSELKEEDKQPLIFLNNNYHPFKNQLEKINNITDRFVYLSSDKSIYYVSKDNYNYKDGFLDIEKSNNELLIFDSTEKYNIIDHEMLIDKKDYSLFDYTTLVKLLEDNKKQHLYNKNISIRIIQEYIKLKYNNKKLYHHLIIINEKDIDTFNTNQFNDFDNNYSQYSFFIFAKYQNYETNDKLMFMLNKLKKQKLTVNIYIINEFYNIYQILSEKLLYFENLIIYKNFLDKYDINILNQYLEHFDTIITDDILLISAFGFCQTNINSSIKYIDNLTKKKFRDLIISSCLNNSELKVYSSNNINKKYKSDLGININYSFIENTLFGLKDYEKLLHYINEHIKKTYIATESGILLVKKITTAILTQQESILNDQVMGIFQNFDNLDQLKDIEILITNTKFNKIKKEIYMKIIDKITDDNKELCKYIVLSLNQELTINDIKKIIKKINDNKQMLELVNKDVLLMFILKAIVNISDKAEITNVIDEFVKEHYNLESAISIDGLIDLSNKFKINKNLIYVLLLSISTKFEGYYKTYDEFIKARETIKNNLLHIKNKINNIDGTLTLDNMLCFSVGNFDLSYQGLPSPDIFKLRSEIFRKICPDLNYKIDTNFKNNKIKVLFHASQFNRYHSVYKDRHQVIKSVADDPRFDVYFSTFDDLNQEVRFTFGNAKHIKLPTKLDEIKNILSKMKLDIIVYAEIGMDARSYFMAHMKLSKKQCNTWGHSDTSGIDTIDYFFSSKLYELDYKEAQTHYTEKLILQNSLCTSYINPLSKHNVKLFKNRYHFGFTNETVIYFCAQSLFKFNPIYDDYLVEILKNVPNSVLLMLNSTYKNKLTERFNNKNISGKIHYFPPMNHFDFMNLMNISDIVLDTYPFGGCNSSFEGFSLNKVIVTQPSIMINGRFTYGFYKKMKLEKYVAHSKDEYIKFAISLGNKPKYRKKIEKQIEENKNVLFLDNDTLLEWKEDLIKISQSCFDHPHN